MELLEASELNVHVDLHAYAEVCDAYLAHQDLATALAVYSRAVRNGVFAHPGLQHVCEVSASATDSGPPVGEPDEVYEVIDVHCYPLPLVCLAVLFELRRKSTLLSHQLRERKRVTYSDLRIITGHRVHLLPKGQVRLPIRTPQARLAVLRVFNTMLEPNLRASEHPTNAGQIVISAAALQEWFHAPKSEWLARRVPEDTALAWDASVWHKPVHLLENILR